jgi:AcrR family transcriptional regulator
VRQQAATVTDTRTRILEAAWRIASRDGVRLLTLKEVGDAAGVSRQGVYLHFHNRAGLLVAMARHHDRVSGFADRVARAGRREPASAFEELLTSWFAYLPEILPVARALEAAATTGGEGGEAFTDRMADWYDVVAAALQRLSDAGLLRAGWTSTEAADWVWARIHPSAWERLVVERGWTPDEFASRTIRSLRHDVLVS